MKIKILTSKLSATSRIKLNNLFFKKGNLFFLGTTFATKSSGAFKILTAQVGLYVKSLLLKNYSDHGNFLGSKGYHCDPLRNYSNMRLTIDSNKNEL